MDLNTFWFILIAFCLRDTFSSKDSTSASEFWHPSSVKIQRLGTQ